MSRILTFSRTFPAYHPRKGEPTYFVEKIWKSLYEKTNGYDPSGGYQDAYDNHFHPMGKDLKNIHQFEPKHHTIRNGNRWKVGDYFSPRVWSGKPYASKMITIAPDIEVKKVWSFEVEIDKDYTCFLIDSKPFCEMNSKLTTNTGQLDFLANNDGLNVIDLLYWFKHPSPFTGQIICWNENLNY